MTDKCVFAYCRVADARAGARYTCSGSAATAAAQGVSVSGRLYHSVSSKPIAGATVAIEGTSSRSSLGLTAPTRFPTCPPALITWW